MMSWRYTNNGNRVVSDGVVVKVYERDARQMYEQRLKDSQYPRRPELPDGRGEAEAGVLAAQAERWDLGSRRLRPRGGAEAATAAYQKLLPSSTAAPPR
jgi:outer membrane lipoprotein carrier protein